MASGHSILQRPSAKCHSARSGPANRWNAFRKPMDCEVLTTETLSHGDCHSGL